MRDEGGRIGKRERSGIHDTNRGGICARDYHHHLQLYGDGGGRADGFGADYRNRIRADRSGVTEAVIR
jgi:hypothetical protein